MKVALLCASAVLGTQNAVFAAAAVSKTSLNHRRNVRGSQPGIAEGAVDAEASAAQLEVPPPADVGPDGFPQLPTVTNLMNSAQSTAQTLSAQAQSLEKRISQVQNEKAARMSKQKEIFEKKLRSQEQENRALLQQNKEVSHEIDVLRSKNTAVTKHAQQLRDANVMMRSELSALEARLRAARSFVKESLSSTDDSRDTALSVLDAKVQEKLLRPAKSDIAAVEQRHHMHNAPRPRPVAVAPPAKSVEAAAVDDDEEFDDDYDAAASLLAISSQVHEAPVIAEEAVAADPRNMLQTLSQEVEALQKQEKDSEAQLKAAFFKDFQVGANRKAALVAQQKALNATRDSLSMLQSKLQTADGHLEATQQALSKRLRQLGTFIQKLGHLAMAPAPEVPHLLQSLPASVTGDAPKKAAAAPVFSVEQSAEQAVADVQA